MTVTSGSATPEGPSGDERRIASETMTGQSPPGVPPWPRQVYIDGAAASVATDDGAIVAANKRMRISQSACQFFVIKISEGAHHDPCSIIPA